MFHKLGQGPFAAYFYAFALVTSITTHSIPTWAGPLSAQYWAKDPIAAAVAQAAQKVILRTDRNNEEYAGEIYTDGQGHYKSSQSQDAGGSNWSSGSTDGAPQGYPTLVAYWHTHPANDQVPGSGISAEYASGRDVNTCNQYGKPAYFVSGGSGNIYVIKPNKQYTGLNFRSVTLDEVHEPGEDQIERDPQTDRVIRHYLYFNEDGGYRAYKVGAPVGRVKVP